MEDKKFIADSMLGKLATWMRVFGYDVEYERRIDDSVLLRRAASEGRVILTRDTLLIKRRGIRGRYFFINSDRVVDQLRQVVKNFAIGEDKFLTRCLRCNLILEEIPKDEVKERVPPYVFETQGRFVTCKRCSRIYWGGTHKENMVKEVTRIVKS